MKPEKGVESPVLFVKEDARQLVDRARDLISGLTNREAALVGKRLCLLSSDPEDVLLGHVLCCFGCSAVFVCSRNPSWKPQWHEPLREFLIRILGTESPHLRLSPLDGLGADTLSQSPDLQVLVKSWKELDFGTNPPFYAVLGLGILPDQPDEAVSAAVSLMRLVGPGGELELLDTPASPLSVQTVRHVEEAAGPIGLGVRLRPDARQPEPRKDQGRKRLSLFRLSGPLHEYPVEGNENALVMAHCRARLEYAANYVQGCDVLEAGAATGIGGRIFLQLGARQVVCLDRCQEALDQGRNKTRDGRVRFRQWDLNQSPLPFDDASFDVIVCLEVLEHITAHETAIAEFIRILRPGGRLIISVPDQAFETEWASLNRFANPYHLRVPSREEFLGLLKGFEQITLAQQRDFVGSAVVEDVDCLPAGEFVTENPDLKNGIAAVQLAVCTKAPASSAKPVTSKVRMVLYDNHSERWLAGYRHTSELEKQCLHDRHALWAAGNLTALRDGCQDFQLAARFFCRVGGIAVSDYPVDPGPWMWTVASLQMSALAASGGPMIASNAPCWKIETNGDSTELIPCTRVPKALHSVVFPTSQHRVRFTTLWYWRRRQAQEFWFCEQDGWHRVGAKATLARRLYRRVVKSFLPASIQNHEQGEDVFLNWALVRIGHSEVKERRYLLNSPAPSTRQLEDVDA